MRKSPIWEGLTRFSEWRWSRATRRSRHWVSQVTAPADYEQVEAWGRRMLLDTRFGSPDDSPADGPPRRLADMRAKLISRYPAVGPIFA